MVKFLHWLWTQNKLNSSALKGLSRKTASSHIQAGTHQCHHAPPPPPKKKPHAKILYAPSPLYESTHSLQPYFYWCASGKEIVWKWRVTLLGSWTFNLPLKMSIWNQIWVINTLLDSRPACQHRTEQESAGLCRKMQDIQDSAGQDKIVRGKTVQDNAR